MNEYEKSCKEWLKGCSCASVNKQEECKECTKAFLDHIKIIGGKVKIGDPKGKKAISKSFRELEKLGFKVWNFSSNKRLNTGMKDFVDYVVLGRNAVHFLELKLKGDKFSDGQADTLERFNTLIKHHEKIVIYNILTEFNYTTIIDLIVRIG